MKNLSNGASHRKGNLFAQQQPLFGFVKTLCLTTVVTIVLAACQKDGIKKSADEIQTSVAKNSQADVINSYDGLSKQTDWELQQARAATAKYRNLDNALKDGYQDIEVDVEHMGHHYMKMSIVDSVFDIRQPEILVYNRDENNNAQLVAVEYAVPLTYAKPDGFTGSADMWNDTSGFPLWLLHAWVWAYNPDGVFNWTNPTVHLH